jgi:hypothetical protein
LSERFLSIEIQLGIAGSLTLNGSLIDTSGFVNVDDILFGNVAIGQGSGTISASDSFLTTIAGFLGSTATSRPARRPSRRAFHRRPR